MVWTDLETTGLDADNDLILEVAVVITDDRLNERAAGAWITDQAQLRKLSDLHPTVQLMHSQNNLWHESREKGLTLARVQREVLALLRGNVEEREAQLAGSTISFDRAFLKRHLPAVEGYLHYRNLDVSSFNEAFRRYWPTVWERRPGQTKSSNHRAMEDIRQSIDVLKFYINKIDNWRLAI